ncbi:MAG: S26 family signal peptidase, partial [Eubacteriales bacterium]
MKNRRFTNIAFVGFTILTLLLVGFICFLIVTHTKTFAVESDSMSPTINKGDAVFIRSLNPQELRAGDVVTVKFTDNSGAFT